MATSRIIALDVGERRIGVAGGWTDVRIAQPMTTVLQTDDKLEALATMINAEDAVAVVIGLPRNLSGSDTGQTEYVRQFADRLRQLVRTKLYFQDEALTSQKAEAELARRGSYDKGAVDALAATYILEDFFEAMPEELRG